MPTQHTTATGRTVPNHLRVTPDDLDQYNFRSDVRRLGRDYRDDALDSSRQIHSFIAHYANLVLEDRIAYDGRVTTTQHNEKIIVTVPNQRNPGWDRSVLIDLREQMGYAPYHGRHYVNKFRDVIAGFVCQVAEAALRQADDYHMRTAEVPA